MINKREEKRIIEKQFDEIGGLPSKIVLKMEVGVLAVKSNELL